jgi:hypothetical protein
MAITGSWFSNALTGQFGTVDERRIDWAGDTINVSLHTGWTPNVDDDIFFTDAIGEISGAGYTAGGVTLTDKSVAYDAALNYTKLVAASIQWTGASFTAQVAAIYKDTGSAATSPLLGYVDFGGDQTVTDGNFTINWNEFGVLTIVTV